MTFNNNSRSNQASGKFGAPFIHQDCGAVRKRPVNHIAVSGHPADRGRAPVEVLILKVKNPFGGEMSLQKITSGRVENAFGFARCT